MKKRVFLFTTGLFQLFLFAIFSYLIHKGFLHKVDFDLTVKLQDHISRRLDYPFSVFSLLGSFEITAVIFLVIYIFSLRKVHRLLIVFSFPLLHIFELLGKFFIYHPGPPFMFLRYAFNLHFPSSYIQSNYSYPSGHVSRTVFLSGLLFFLILRSRLGFFKKLFFYSLIILFSLLMIVSRIYLGEHWFSDTLGGILLGLSVSTLTLAVW